MDSPQVALTSPLTLSPIVHPTDTYGDAEATRFNAESYIKYIKDTLQVYGCILKNWS